VPELPSELVQIIQDGMALRPRERIQSVEELAERLRPFAGASQFLSLAPHTSSDSEQPVPLIVAPTLDRIRIPNSVIPVDMPRVARVRDSLLTSPRIPRAPSTPKMRLGRDFMPMPGDPGYGQLQDARRSQTLAPRRRGAFRREVMPALVATGIGFGLGVVLAWSAGLL
jgi:hypothetical protein